MSDNWRWTPHGICDGDVPIVWAARMLSGEMLVGVMADYEDAFIALPKLIESHKEMLELVAALVMTIGCKYGDDGIFDDRHIAEIVGRAKAARKAARWPEDGR